MSRYSVCVFFFYYFVSSFFILVILFFQLYVIFNLSFYISHILHSIICEISDDADEILTIIIHGVFRLLTKVTHVPNDSFIQRDYAFIEYVLFFYVHRHIFLFFFLFHVSSYLANIFRSFIIILYDSKYFTTQRTRKNK